MIRNLLSHFLLCLLLTVAATAAPASVNPLATAVGKQTETQPAAASISELSDAEIDAHIAKLQARFNELRLQSGTEAVTVLGTTYQDAATPDELALWERLVNQLTGILEDHILALARFKDYRKELQGKLNEIKSWQGFAEKPPYSITQLDILLDILESKQGVLKSLDVISVSLEEEFREFSNSLKQSNKQVRLAEEALERDAGTPGELRSSWLLQLARLQNEVNQAGTLFGERRRIATRERQKIAQAEVDFVNQKLAIIRGNYRFSADELKEKQQSIEKQLSELQLKLQQTKSIEKAARRQLDRLDAAVNKAQAELAAGGRTKDSLPRLLSGQKVQMVVFENTTIETLILNGLVNLLKREKIIWEDRYQIAAGNSNRELPRNELDLVVKWQDYITNKISAAEALAKNLQEKLAAAPAGSEEYAADRVVLGLYQEQAEKFGKALPILKDFEQLVLRRNEELKNERQSLAVSVKNSFALLVAQIKKIWLTELYVAEETIIVEDRKITRPRSVTIGKVVQAVLILLIGTWIIRYLKKMLYLLATSRLKLSDNEAHLYTRLLTYIMFVVVLVSSLVFVNIPLAIFTFFGGALAIGIGFGAQALISNFISGLILMFDRTIRMGDMVEVDGHRGRIASIGMRSSSIKRLDGVEMYVPNSAFLQQNVINWTASDTKIRYSIPVGVAYGSPTKIVERVLLLAVEAQPEVLRDPPPYIIFESFADSSLNFTAYLWMELTPDVNNNEILSDIRHRIGERLADAGISIPFPQRDLHLTTDKPLEVRMTAD